MKDIGFVLIESEYNRKINVETWQWHSSWMGK